MNKRGALIKNERFKLYRKPSTIVVIIIVIALSLLFFSIPIIENLINGNYEEYSGDWNADLKAEIKNTENYLSQIDDVGENIPLEDYFHNERQKQSYKSNIELYKFIVDNDISPSSWQLDILTQKYSLKYKVRNSHTYYDTYYDYYPSFSSKEEVDEYFILTAEEEAEIARLDKILENKNWKDYVNGEIKSLETLPDSKIEGSDSAIKIDVLKMHLEMDIEPYPNSVIRTERSSFRSEDAWKSDELQKISNMKKALINKTSLESNYSHMNNVVSIGGIYNYGGNIMTHAEEARIESELAKSFQKLKSDTKPYSGMSVPGILNTFISAITMMIAMFGIFVGGSVFSSEYSSGTIKLLVITPYKRQKIYWAKIRCVLEAIIAVALAIFLLGVLFTGLFTGFKDVGTPIITMLFGKAVTIPNILNTFLELAKGLVSPLMFTFLAVMLSVTSKRSAPSIALPMMILVLGTSIFSLILEMTRNMVQGAPVFAKYIFFIVSSPDMLSSLSISSLFAIIVMAVSTACFLFIGRDSFCRKDIK